MQRGTRLPLTVIPAITALLWVPARPAAAQIRLVPFGTFSRFDPADIFDQGAAEIVAHDPETQRLFISNAGRNRIEILELRGLEHRSGPGSPYFRRSIKLGEFGAGPNSVAVKNGLVAVAEESDPRTDPGVVVFFDPEGEFLAEFEVGGVPDMVTFTPDGRKLLVANEGEPSDDYTIDPEGSVSIIDLSRGLGAARVHTAGFGAFNRSSVRRSLIASGVRIYGPDASVAQDLEPEYIAVSPDSNTAWVTLQENNALGVLDLARGEFTSILPLGFKDHSRRGNGLDASDEDGEINIATWPVLGMYLPDAIAVYEVDGQLYLVTANEGDTRDYDGFSEEARVEDLKLARRLREHDPGIQAPEKLGRLKVTSSPPRGIRVRDDGTEVFTELFSFGGRSFSIWSAADARLVFDSGDQLETITGDLLPDDFNSDNTENRSFDSRSDDKGPEPEGVTIGEIGDRFYAFICLERIGGVAVFDVTVPSSPTFVTYETQRDFNEDAAAGEAVELGPESSIFIAAGDSPNGEPLLVVAHEVSGSVTIYRIRPAR
jgi:DNA-binding beta-propeller fold protein YncE